jgi:hypothetical protein
VLWEFLVCVPSGELSNLLICIGSKECRECGCLTRCTLKDVGWIIVWVEANQVLTGKVDLQQYVSV